jgi:alpha-beta hydrolase superfamily lysophospholipase
MNTFKYDKISFIGHSMGGVIIRSALLHLKAFRDKFSVFISLSSPHLGYMFNPHAHIDLGSFE